jgi:hypothetical protein
MKRKNSELWKLLVFTLPSKRLLKTIIQQVSLNDKDSYVLCCNSNAAYTTLLTHWSRAVLHACSRILVFLLEQIGAAHRDWEELVQLMNDDSDRNTLNTAAGGCAMAESTFLVCNKM